MPVCEAQALWCQSRRFFTGCSQFGALAFGPVPILPSHLEQHSTGRTGWLRAAVLGANDGLVSTASLVLGVAASGADQAAVVTAGIYEERGLSPQLAREVAEDLSKGDVLAVHARDELGITDYARARPLQAATASALSFALGALLPLLAVLPPYGQAERIWVTVVVTVIGLIVLGAAGAKLGGAPVVRAAV